MIEDAVANAHTRLSVFWMRKSCSSCGCELHIRSLYFCAGSGSPGDCKAVGAEQNYFEGKSLHSLNFELLCWTSNIPALNRLAFHSFRPRSVQVLLRKQVDRCKTWLSGRSAFLSFQRCLWELNQDQRGTISGKHINTSLFRADLPSYRWICIIIKLPYLLNDSFKALMDAQAMPFPFPSYFQWREDGWEFIRSPATWPLNQRGRG